MHSMFTRTDKGQQDEEAYLSYSSLSSYKITLFLLTSGENINKFETFLSGSREEKRMFLYHRRKDEIILSIY